MDAHARAYEEKLIAAMRERGILAEHLRFEVSCHSVVDAAAAVGGSPEDFVKSICLLPPDGAGRLVVAIVKGEDRVDRARVAQAAGAAKLRLADAHEVLARTGYPAGGTPPFAFEAEFLIDPRVMERGVVYAGGGSPRALVRVASADIVRATGARVVEVRKVRK